MNFWFFNYFLKNCHLFFQKSEKDEKISFILNFDNKYEDRSVLFESNYLSIANDSSLSTFLNLTHSQVKIKNMSIKNQVFPEKMTIFALKSSIIFVYDLYIE